jgi:hypothetical protein
MNRLPLISKASDIGLALALATTQAEARAVIGAGTGGGGEGGGAVDSVNGQTGEVVLGAADVGAAPAGAPVSSFPNDAGYITDADIPGSPVLSVNGKTGAVALVPADIGAATAAQGALAATAVQPSTLTAGLESKSNVPTAWATPALNNGFAGLTGYGALQYRLNGDVVEFRGTIASASHEGGATTLALFTLPVGYRPGQTGIFTAQTYTTAVALARIDILADGRVDYVRSYPGTSTPYLAMDGISFAKA